MAKRPLVEDCAVLDVCRMARDGRLVHGERGSGRITFRNKLSITYEYDGRTSLTLRYPDGRSQRLMLYRMPMPLGGHRWMFRPAVDRFAFKLYLPKGGDVFRSRDAWGLGYTSRSVGWKKRQRWREDKFYLRWGAVEIIKPSGMWNSTWKRKRAELAAIKSRGLEGAETR